VAVGLVGVTSLGSAQLSKPQGSQTSRVTRIEANRTPDRTDCMKQNSPPVLALVNQLRQKREALRHICRFCLMDAGTMTLPWCSKLCRGCPSYPLLVSTTAASRTPQPGLQLVKALWGLGG
jgi:hypothetical protein